ncbi:MAG TPA: EutP/PduV family microcompartment system protein [Clostridiales bacterium]|nr:EutP/PduV family microcompartment system protein [Clostridiales bacterium]
MKRIILMGRTGAGKTTLTQALKGEKIKYHKTQYTNFYNSIIDTPGEYAESKHLGRALALYSYEADIVGLLISATDNYSLIPPNVTCMANREVIGIVTQMEHPEAVPKRAEAWLRLAGCEKIFFVDSKSGEGVDELLDYLQYDRNEIDSRV